MHYVTTEDGYILTMHRLRNQGAQPFLLQHGLVDSSAGYVVMGPNVSLGEFVCLISRFRINDGVPLQPTYWLTMTMMSGWAMHVAIATRGTIPTSIRMPPSSGILVGMRLECMIYPP